MKPAFFFPVLLTVAFAGGLVVAQQVEKPTLTDTQKLQLQNLSQRIEIAQLRAQLAQRDFDAAKREITVYIEQLKVEGYLLDLGTLTYVPEQDSAPGKDDAP